MSLLQIYLRALGYLAEHKRRVGLICASNVVLAIVTIAERDSQRCADIEAALQGFAFEPLVQVAQAGQPVDTAA